MIYADCIPVKLKFTAKNDPAAHTWHSSTLYTTAVPNNSHHSDDVTAHANQTFHSLIMSSGILTDAWSIKSGYTPVKQPFKEGFQYLYPEAGNVVSTIQDLHKWNQCLGKLFKNKLILQEFTKSRVFNIKLSGRAYDFCLGLRKSIQEPIEYGQSGWIYGYQTASLFFPKQRISAVILENVSRIGGIKIPPLDFSAHDRIIAKVRSYINEL